MATVEASEMVALRWAKEDSNQHRNGGRARIDVLAPPTSPKGAFRAYMATLPSSSCGVCAVCW